MTKNSCPLEFDPAEHRYTLHGKRVPGVTTILQELGLYPEYPPDPRYRARGSAVHAAAKLFMEGRFDRERSGPGLRGYIDSLQGFLSASDFRPKHLERAIWSESWRCAGTLDLHGGLQGVNTLVDLKTGAPAMAARLQTAAYVLMLKECAGIETVRRFTVQLYPDGSPGRPEEHLDLARDIRNFLSAASVWHLRQEFGVAK